MKYRERIHLGIFPENFWLIQENYSVWSVVFMAKYPNASEMIEILATHRETKNEHKST